MGDETIEAAKAEAAAERSAATIEVSGKPTNSTDAILAAIAGVSQDVRDLGSRIDDHDDELRSLRRAIHGSKRPPDANGTDDPNVRTIPIIEMARRGSGAAFDVEELRGELLAVRSELKKQSSVMGIGKTLREYLTSAAFGKTVVRLATLAGAAYAAFRASGH